jgi:hypothetical protein
MGQARIESLRRHGGDRDSGGGWEFAVRSGTDL